MALTPSFEPVRDQWWGRRTSNPAPLAQLQRGAWWYRTDIRVFCYWDGLMVHCWGGVGGHMMYGTGTIVCPTAGNYVINVNISVPWAPILINRIVSVLFDADPDTDPGTPLGAISLAPVVGFTVIGVGAGTTLTARVVVMGW